MQTETLPIVYTPTVGQACLDFHRIWTSTRGLYVSHHNLGEMRSIMDNWSQPVDVIVVSDGSRILGLGDLGANGMGIPIGKLALYVAAGGIDPARTLPILVDTGTNNVALREDPLYLGCRHPRIEDDEYYRTWEELLMAVKDKWPKCLLQFEDISNDHCFELLKRYRDRMLSFNDDIQGTGAVVLAGFINSLRLSKIKAADARILFFGAGSAATGVADTIVNYLVFECGIERKDAFSQFWFVDSTGLVTNNRGGRALAAHKIPYARADRPEGEVLDLHATVAAVMPTHLFGLAAVAGAFDDELIRTVGEHVAMPSIFALSNPTSKAECLSTDAYKLLDGNVCFASGSPMDSYTDSKGKVHVPGQANNMYIFPGVGLGAVLAQADTISDRIFVAAAKAVAELVSDESLEADGNLYPSVDDIRAVNKVVAVATIKQAQAEGVVTAEIPDDIAAFVSESMYVPGYKDMPDMPGMPSKL